MRDKIIATLESRDLLIAEISEIIGFKIDESTPIYNELETRWSVDREELQLSVDDEPLEDNAYTYVISSIGTRGKELFIGTKDDITFVSAYDEQDGWASASIFILDNKNKEESDD